MLRQLRAWLSEYEAATGYGMRARAYIAYDRTTFGSTNAVGRRAWSCDGSGRSVWTYDAYGRVVTQDRTTDGQLYRTQSTYALEWVRIKTFPDGETITHSYGLDLNLTTVRSSIGATLFSNAVYNPWVSRRRGTSGRSPARRATGGSTRRATRSRRTAGCARRPCCWARRWRW